MKGLIVCFLLYWLCIVSPRAWAFARPDKEYKVFQFPRTAIPRIDGDFSDWEIVPDSYSVGLSELYDTHGGRGSSTRSARVRPDVKVGWWPARIVSISTWRPTTTAGTLPTRGCGRIFSNWWSMPTCPEGRSSRRTTAIGTSCRSRTFISKDTERMHRITISSLRYSPARIGLWCGARLRGFKDFPYANVAYDYDFAQGESGTLRMEFWITPFDYAAVEGIRVRSCRGWKRTS